MKKSQRILAAVTALLLFTAPICLASGSEVGFIENFEDTAFVLNSTISGIRSWTGTAADFTIASDPKGGTNQVAKSTALWNGAATRSFTPITNVGQPAGTTVEVTFRVYGGRDSRGAAFSVGGTDGANKVVSQLCMAPVSAGTDLKGLVISADSRRFYINAAGSTGATMGNRAANLTYVLNTSINATTWYWFRMQFNLSTNTYNVYMANTPVTDSMIVNSGEAGNLARLTDLPFATGAENVTAINNVAIRSLFQSTGWYCYFDDVMVTLSGMSIEPDAKFNVQAGSATYTVSGNTVNVQANLTMPVVGAGSASVLAVAYGADNELLAADATFLCDKTDLEGTVIPFQKTLTTNGATVEKVKLFVWKSYATRVPYCSATLCTAQ